jgi:hypothetical protein
MKNRRNSLWLLCIGFLSAEIPCWADAFESAVIQGTQMHVARYSWCNKDYFKSLTPDFFSMAKKETFNRIFPEIFFTVCQDQPRNLSPLKELGKIAMKESTEEGTWKAESLGIKEIKYEAPWKEEEEKDTYVDRVKIILEDLEACRRGEKNQDSLQLLKRKIWALRDGPIKTSLLKKFQNIIEKRKPPIQKQSSVLERLKSAFKSKQQ